VEEGEAVLEDVVLGREGGLQVVLGNPQVLQHHHPYHLQVAHLSINQLNQSIKTSRWPTYPLINQNIQVAHLSINQFKPPGDEPIHQLIKTSR
jgi:hypothetical protein